MPDKDGPQYHTLAGLIMTHLGRLPNEGEIFQWTGFTFEIVKMDSNRVDKVLVTPDNAKEI